VWVDRSGVLLDSLDLHEHYLSPRLSPDGSSLLLTRVEPGKAGLWTLPLADRALKRLSCGPARAAFGVWAPDSRGFVFASWPRYRSTLFVMSSPGEKARALLDQTSGPDRYELNHVPQTWSSDGRWIVFTGRQGENATQLYLLRAGTTAPALLIRTRADVHSARFSPDGKWLAFASNLPGRDEIYVTPFASRAADLPIDPRDLIRISNQGGHSPEWGSNRELFYISAEGDLMSFDLETAPRRLFHVLSLGAPAYEYRSGGYCPDREGQRLLFALGTALAPLPPAEARGAVPGRDRKGAGPIDKPY
jgi:Tol biopolymer transport system component